MRFQGALIRHGQVKFGVVAVNDLVVDDQQRTRGAILAAHRFFPGVPVVITGRDTAGRRRFVGRPDIARFLSRMSIDQIPWREFEITSS
jgi:hypothetical protein